MPSTCVFLELFCSYGAVLSLYCFYLFSSLSLCHVALRAAFSSCVVSHCDTVQRGLTDNTVLAGLVHVAETLYM